MPPKYTDAQRVAAFWSKVDVRGPVDCWLWKGAKSDRRYGHLLWGGKTTKAHRVAFFLSGGYIPEGQQVCHTCDNPLCCNPSHLFAGSQKDNIQDALQKGRLKVPKKLIAADIVLIRADHKAGMSQREIATKYGIDQSNVSCIVAGKTWKHLPT